MSPPAGFPHSVILGSRLVCSSPRLIAAYHDLHRLSMPRHPPCALLRLISISIVGRAKRPLSYGRPRVAIRRTVLIPHTLISRLPERSIIHPSIVKERGGSHFAALSAGSGSAKEEVNVS